MSTAHLYAGYQPGVPTDAPTVSFELYPPRNISRDSGVWAGIQKLTQAAPNYVSVTYGAGGAKVETRDHSVQVLLAVLDQDRDLPAVAHLTCVGSTRGELSMIVRLLLRAGIRDFLALRGDLPPNDDHESRPEELTRTVELISLIREIAATELPEGVGTGPGGSGPTTAPNPADYVSIAVAAYPATTGLARANEIAALVEKRDAGADYAISQVFYDAADYVSLVSELHHAGVDLPIIPGILPLNDYKRLKAMERLAGIPIPPQIQEIFDESEPGPERVARTLGATVDLITACLAGGAPGVHLYSFNRVRPVLDIVEYLRGCGLLHPRRPGGRPAEVDSDLVSVALRRLTPNA